MRMCISSLSVAGTWYLLSCSELCLENVALFFNFNATNSRGSGDLKKKVKWQNRVRIVNRS